MQRNTIQRIVITAFFVLIAGGIAADRLALPDSVSTICMILAVIALGGYFVLKYRQMAPKTNLGEIDAQTPVVLTLNSNFRSASEAVTHMRAATSAEYSLHKTLLDQDGLRASVHWAKGRLGNSLFLIEIHAVQMKEGTYAAVLDEFRNYVATEWNGEPVLDKALAPFRAHLVNVIAFADTETKACSELMNAEQADKEFLILPSWIGLADGKLHLLWPTDWAYSWPLAVPGFAQGSTELLQEKIIEALNFGKPEAEQLKVSFRGRAEDDGYDGPRL
jgi:hypothetical protein